MIGTIIGGAIGLGSSIFGGIKSARAARNAKKQQEQQRKKNEQWYNRSINEDPTQRADTMALMERTEDMMRRRTRAAQGSAAVMGATDSAAIAEKQAANETMANIVSNIAANNEARKTSIEQQYLQNDANYAQAMQQAELMRAQNIAQAVSQAGQAAGGIASNLSEIDWKKKS